MKRFFPIFLFIIPMGLACQQVSDTNYQPVISSPAYEPGKGPVVFIDEGHNNFHTKDGRYKAFSDLLARDGYVVLPYTGEFTRSELDKGKILVISNALHATNVNAWYLPNPSAFTAEEIETVKVWVAEGGSLFLIADHMPMAGAARDLAVEFGFEFTNGFVFHEEDQSPDFFSLKNGTLRESMITKGRNADETVTEIATFTGQGFMIPDDAHPILVFDERYINYLPDTAWVFDDHTTQIGVLGWSQGAYKEFGKGKIVAFGEAAMFTAQLAGTDQRKVGMNHERAAENFQLLLNIMHWLDGMIK